MDSAKNKKSFPDFAEASVHSEGRHEAFADFGSPKSQRFELPSGFWNRIESDPDLKAEWDARVEKRAREIFDSEAAVEKQAIFEAARQEGIAQGLREGAALAGESCRKLESLAESILGEKEAMLRAHEVIWCRAFSHLARRFLIPLSAERLTGLRTWLEDAIGDLGRQAKIRVCVSPKVHQEVKSVVGEGAAHWEWIEDRALRDSDFRVELTGGGVFFSPEAEWKKFEEKLNEVLGNPVA